MPVANKAKKEAERKNYKERRNKTNTSDKRKMAALIRQANKRNQMTRWKGW